MSKYFYDDFDDLENYMNRRNFSKSLKQKYRKTFKLSVKYGDGKVWTDSLLLTTLTSSKNNLNNFLSSLPGSRGKILSSARFENTLTTQALTYDFHPQTKMDEEIERYAMLNPEKKITEETIFLIEIQAAMGEIGGKYTDLNIFLNDLLYHYNEFSSNNKSSDKNINIKRYLFSTKIIDAFYLSFLVKIHPFDIFDNGAKEHDNFFNISYYYTGVNCLNKLKRFLYLMRDNINVSCLVIPDDVLDRIIKSWSDEQFRDVCSLEDESSEEGDMSKNYKDAAFYATALLAKENYPLALLLDRLENHTTHSGDNNWIHSEKLMFYLDNEFKKIKILPVDYYGIDQYEYKNGIYQKINYGFSNPNPIWNESIIETLEYYIEKNELENVFQYFFELYPSFILDDLHVKSIPQPILSNYNGRLLKPDFVVQKINSENIDIIEIKRPIKKILSGNDNRPYFCNELEKGIAQLNDYRNWFKDNQNRKMFYSKYKLDGFNPTLTLIIGRSSGFRNEEVRRRVTEGRNVNILTYDDIVDISRQRKLRLL
jgi:hypothetical protein